MTAFFQTIALIGKHKSPEIAEPLLRLARFLTDRRIKVVIDKLTAMYIGETNYPILSLEEIGDAADLAIVIGGDGTMLNIARTLAPYDVALIGVNQGRLGFLTDLSIDTMFETIGSVLEGAYVTENRMLLSAEIVRNENGVFNVLAFNDVVISKGVRGGMIEFDVYVDDHYVYTQRSDGLIISTPTGSTAYALSAGGPILHPSLSVIALVPVCPHTLSNRPIAISSDSIVVVDLVGVHEARAHFDSHSHFDVKQHDKLVVRRYEKPIRLLHPQGHNYYHMLREKLHWSEVF